MKKIRKNRGESIAETLVALLITAMAAALLAAAIVSAAKINSKITNDDVAFTLDGSGPAGQGTVTLSMGGYGGTTINSAVNIDIYGASNGYSYYEYSGY